jgi:hypothetical protein
MGLGKLIDMTTAPRTEDRHYTDRMARTHKKVRFLPKGKHKHTEASAAKRRRGSATHPGGPLEAGDSVSPVRRQGAALFGTAARHSCRLREDAHSAAPPVTMTLGSAEGFDNGVAYLNYRPKK